MVNLPAAYMAAAIPPQGVLITAVAVTVLALLAEWLHTRKVRRIWQLAFGTQKAHAWVHAVPVLRPVALGLLTWGMLTLLGLDGRPAEISKTRLPDRHLLLALDVSPSMYLKDAGLSGKQSRQERAADVMQSILDRLDMTRTKVTVVGFYTSARPVVIDTGDMAVVNNIIRDLPLAQAFKEGQTNMYSGVKEAAKVAEKWKPGSATLVVVSDGDTVPETEPPHLPSAIADTLVVGVGNPHRGLSIAGRSSRQDGSALKHLAAKIKGQYHDGNTRHLPTTVLSSLSMLSLKEDQSVPLRTVALVCVASGAFVLAAIPVALAIAAFPRRIASTRATRTHPTIEAKPESKPELRHVQPVLAGGVS